MNERTEIDILLDDAFRQLRADAIQPDDALMARITADAAAAMPPRSAAAPAQRPRSFWRALAEAVGGWQGGMALTASAVAGLWIGYAGNDVLDTVYQSALGSQAEVTDSYAEFIELALQEG